MQMLNLGLPQEAVRLGMGLRHAGLTSEVNTGENTASGALDDFLRSHKDRRRAVQNPAEEEEVCGQGRTQKRCLAPGKAELELRKHALSACG